MIVNGMRVLVNDLVTRIPRMQLTPTVYDNLPRDFAEDINQWMREFFGYEEKAFIMDGMLVVSRQAFKQLQEVYGDENDRSGIR